MKTLEIIGNQKLTGNINISGAKNSAVALIPATLLASGTTTLNNIPDILDIDILEQTLKYLKVDVKRSNKQIIINSNNLINRDIPIELSSKLRASYYFMAVLLAKFKIVKMYFPGGCQIGIRPIDQTLKAFKLLGATIKEENCLFTIEAKELIGTEFELDMPSVGATINALLVATLAKGTTIIKNAALEPEIGDLIDLLNKMGASIDGKDTNCLTIQGVSKLKPTTHEIIPDRIEAGTYTIIGALLGQDLKINNIIPKHIKSLTDKLEEMGANIKIYSNYLIINNSKLKPINIKTATYPGFPTDLQQPFVSLLTKVKGISQVEENIYENRFMNIPYLNKMGANIIINSNKAIITGVLDLTGQEVEATDLRAGASLLIAGLVANGKTTITNINHLLRGYEQILEKLTNVGAKIEIKEI